jgi:hypothetical protein
MNCKTLVIFAGVVMLIALFALTFAPVQQVAAQGPTATPVPPVAVLKVVAVPGNAADPNTITATISYITDSNLTAPAKSTVGLYTSGLGNVPINVPVVLQVSPQDPKNTGTATWSLTKPADSKATITGTLTAKFTPDVVGAYYVQVTLKNAAGLTSAAQFAFFNAGTFVGATAGNCKQCHPSQATEWAKTPHALLVSQELDNQIDGPRGVAPTNGFITHYAETCVRCHSTGYYPAPYGGSGGYWDAKAKANWVFPTWKQIDEVFTKKTPSNWAAAPDAVKNMATIGCEDCHGPAAEHVKNGAKVMEVSWENGACDQCHAAGGSHSRGIQITYSKHTTGASFEEVFGPGEQGCVRCHSGAGFASFLANPKNQAAWDNQEAAVGCPTCHDPHSDANAFQLRLVGKPVEVASLPTPKDVGLSAVCETCHNTRRNPADAVTALAANGNPSYPHYSSAAELLSDTGGITYGATVPNSPHGLVVGVAPVSTGVTTTGSAKFKWSSIDDTKGNTPGPCVVCHMWDAVTAPLTDTFAMNVGGHSFNMVASDGKSDYGAACKSCHGVVTDFNMKAKADYDGNGKVEGVQDEIKGLLNATWSALEAKGWKKNNTGGSYADIPTTADAKQKAAWYNFRTVYGVMWGLAADGTQNIGNQGKAAAIHNFKRSCALLQLSLKDLGATPAAATDCTK